MYALPGDINRNGVVDTDDSALIPGTRNYTSPLYNYLGDVNGSNVVKGMTGTMFSDDGLLVAKHKLAKFDNFKARTFTIRFTLVTIG